MASEAAIDDLFTGIGLAFFKLPVAPSARAGITLRVFDFDLDVGGLPAMNDCSRPKAALFCAEDSYL